MCKVENCQNKHHALGFCRKHHTRFKRNGTTVSKYDVDKYVDLGGIKDTGKGRRGNLAVNVVNDIKYKAKKRGKNWDLSHQEAFNLIINKCEYCGFEPHWPHLRNGIDRVDNNIGYQVDNCVSCCFTCNSAKKEMSVKEFKEWICRIYEHLINK